MATKSFLTEAELSEAVQRLPSLPSAPDGNERRGFLFPARDFSLWLGECLLRRLAAHADWLSAEPVIIGSWAREELTPKSDIDLIFLGPEDVVMRLVEDYSRSGLKLRYRVPEDPADWTFGVEPFDVLALLSALPVTPFATEQLELQIEKLQKRPSRFRRELLKAMCTDRKARADRHDSISSYLEPNLKYGPGGLRDLGQAIMTRQLFPERFSGEQHDHAFIVLHYYKGFFLMVRQRLHLSVGATDVLTAPEQKPIADALGFKEPKDFMREIQKGLSRVSFYADWVVAQAVSTKARISAVEKTELKTVSDLFAALEADSSILMQNQVRLHADEVFANAEKRSAASAEAALGRTLGRQLTRILDPATSEDAMVAVFRSRLIDHCVPEFRKIIGYVQHDQYHRFTVDAHLLQVLRELKRLHQHPARAGKLEPRVRALSRAQWEILAFACLFHDLAKGRGGDHAEKGVELARRELARFGKSAVLIQDVCWIVQEHLAMSVAAFRENPRSPQTWKSLAQKGVVGERISLLTLFTVVDILGTNPEAWTPWKERLLHDLAAVLERPETNALIEFGQAVDALKVPMPESLRDRLVETLDPFLIGSLPARTLLKDLSLALNQELQPKAVSVRGGRQVWIRFHSRVDRPGLFLRYVTMLSGIGLSVRHASILTDPDLGVYDWFEVKTTRSLSQIQSQLKLQPKTEAAIKAGSEKKNRVHFDVIEIVSHDKREWVVSFKGRDQSGALVEAARALVAVGAEIRWAKVHTWGRQIDDVFGISPFHVEPTEVVEKLTLAISDGQKV